MTSPIELCELFCVLYIDTGTMEGDLAVPDLYFRPASLDDLELITQMEVREKSVLAMLTPIDPDLH